MPESHTFTARVRRTRVGNICTSECLSVHHWWGGGYPVPGLDGGGGTPSQVWMVGEGTPSQVWMVGGIHHPRSDGGGGYPIPRLMVGEVPHLRSGWWGCTQSQVWMVGGTLSQVWMVGGVPEVPPTMTG